MIFVDNHHLANKFEKIYFHVSFSLAVSPAPAVAPGVRKLPTLHWRKFRHFSKKSQQRKSIFDSFGNSFMPGKAYYLRSNLNVFLKVGAAKVAEAVALPRHLDLMKLNSRKKWERDKNYIR